MIFKNRFCINKTAFTLAEVFHLAGKSRKAAFTLAEVLITLGIIGVVAALTIPSLIQNYHKKVLVNQLKKHVSTMEQGFQKMLADDGVDEINNTKFYQALDALEDEYEKYYALNYLDDPDYKNAVNILHQYFNFTHYKDGKTYNTKYLSGNETSHEGWVMAFADGSLLNFQEILFEDNISEQESQRIKQLNNSKACTETFEYMVDLNGEKGPNQYGRDIFCFILDANGRVWSTGVAHENWQDNPSLCGELGKPLTGNLLGTACAARIIENGWQMDY